MRNHRRSDTAEILFQIALLPVKAFFGFLFGLAELLLKGDDDDEGDDPLSEVPKGETRRVEISDRAKVHTWTSSHTGL